MSTRRAKNRLGTRTAGGPAWDWWSGTGTRTTGRYALRLTGASHDRLRAARAAIDAQQAEITSLLGTDGEADLQPTGGVWSHVKRSLGNLAAATVDQLTRHRA